MKLFEWFEKRQGPHLDWIQVGISSLCTAACVYCPRVVYSYNWKHGLMSPRIFDYVAGAFKYTKFVHLQGWGEPLLHPMFLDFVLKARKAGCTVGTTTSGQTITPEGAKKLTEEGPDIIAFSVAGCSQISDKYRNGTSFEKTIKTIEIISAQKEKLGLKSPVIHIAYMLFMSALKEVRKIRTVFGSLGVEQIVISTLNYVADPNLMEESFLHCNNEHRKRAEEILWEAVEASADTPPLVFINFPPFHNGRGCLENSSRSLFISHDGFVYPCVYLGIPVKEPLEQTRVLVHHFGNIEYASLPEIWHSTHYKQWRKKSAQAPQSKMCRYCGRFWP